VQRQRERQEEQAPKISRDQALAPARTARLPHPSEQDYADAYRPSEEEPHNTLYVKGLPFDCTEQQLTEAIASTFASLEVLAVVMIRSEDGDPTGTAYVVLSGMPFDGFATGSELKQDSEGTPWKGVIARKSLRRIYTEDELDAELDEFMGAERRVHEALLDAELEANAEGRLETEAEVEAVAVADVEVEEEREGGYDEGLAEEAYENQMVAEQQAATAVLAKPAAKKAAAAKKTTKPAAKKAAKSVSIFDKIKARPKQRSAASE
jgi:hypothetical protein